MALTRAQIKSLVQGYTGKLNKDSLIETLCDLALNEAVRRHPFGSSRATSELTGVVGTLSYSMSTLPNTLVNIISIELLDSENVSTLVTLKPTWWFSKHAGSRANLGNGRPEFVEKQGINLVFDRGFDEAYTIKVTYSYYPTFASDETECPIKVLDTFVVNYVTAHVFLSIEDKENFGAWMNRAVGFDFGDWRGGEFYHAVKADKDEYAQENSFMDVSRSSDNKPVFITDDGRTWYRPC